MQSSTTAGAMALFEYDELKRLSGVNDAYAGVTTYDYDAAGNLANVQYTNGVSHSYHYDSRNRLKDLYVMRGLTTLGSYSYTLGAAGNRLRIVEASGRESRYVYDRLYRLTDETILNDPNGINGSVGYKLDAVGNRLNRYSTLQGINNQQFGYSANDLIATDTYDANGNTLLSTQLANVIPDKYDSQNKLINRTDGTNVVQLWYDGEGNRVKKDANGTITYYCVELENHTGYSQVVEEHTGTGTTSALLNRVNSFGHDLFAQSVIIEGFWTTTWLGFDGQGSSRISFDDFGEANGQFTYDSYGNIIAINNPGQIDHLYTGEQFVPELGLYYLRARYNNPGTGRFWTMDTYEGTADGPHSLHKYLYCSASPVVNIDPSGEFTIGGVLGAMNSIVNVASVAYSSYSLTKAAITGDVNAFDILGLLPFGVGRIGRVAYSNWVRSLRVQAWLTKWHSKTYSLGETLARAAGRARGRAAANLGTEMHELVSGSWLGRTFERLGKIAESMGVQFRLNKGIPGARGDGARPDFVIQLDKPFRIAFVVDIKPVPEEVFRKGVIESIKYLDSSSKNSIGGRRRGTEKFYKANNYSIIYTYLPCPSFAE